MTSVTRQYDVIVVGAGLIGAAFALNLARTSKFKIALVERASRVLENSSPNQRVLALGELASDLLGEMGIFQQLSKEYCHPYKKMFIWDEHSAGELSFVAQDYARDSLGYIVDGLEATLILQRAIEGQDNIDVLYEFTADSIELSHTRVCINGNTNMHLSTKLLVAADGANSWVRREAKIFSNKKSYQQTAIVAQIETQKPHADTAWQIFLSDGPLAVLPLKNNLSSIVWSTANDTAKQLMELPDSEFAQAIGCGLQGKLGTITVRSPRQSFPLSSARAEHYLKRRLVLIGDAAHSIHPLAGQGANLGFKDVLALSEVLSDLDADQLGDLALLSRYERARKADNEQTDLMMSMLNKAFQGDVGLWTELRAKGMNMITESDVLKKMLVSQAMGF